MIPQWPRKFIKDDGSCVHLKEDNSCAIYKTRPMLCRVDDMIDLLEVDKDEYYKLNISLCNKWMEEDGMEHLKIESPQ